MNYNNNFAPSNNNKCPVGNPFGNTNYITTSTSFTKRGKKNIYPILKNKRGGHYYNAAMPQNNNYPGYEYLQKYMEHYDALKKQGKSVNANSNKDSEKKESEKKSSNNEKKTEEKKEFKVPDELKKIVKELEEQVANKLQNISKDTKGE